MKCYQLLLVTLALMIQLSIVSPQWPKVENIKKSHYLPSLEVKIHPPDIFQPKVQAAIQEMEEKREKKERTWMSGLEQAYNKELEKAAKEIGKIIKDALSLFDDNELLKKSVEYAITAPVVVMSNNNKPINENSAGENKLGYKRSSFNASFKQVNPQQAVRPTMPHTSLPQVPMKNMRFLSRGIIENKHSLLFQNGPIDARRLNRLKMNFPRYPDVNLLSFLELQGGGGGTYTKPIQVEMKVAKEPDGSIKSEISKMEKKRETAEKKLFDKAEEEFKLITKVTVKELQVNLKQELLPFYVVSKSTLQGIDEVIKGSVPKAKQAPGGRFIQLDKDDIDQKFGDVVGKMTEDPVAFNRHIYTKMLNFFSNRADDYTNTKIDHDKYVKEKNDYLKSSLDVDYKSCIELSSKFPNLNLDCQQSQRDYNEINDYLHTAFLQLKQGGNDFINVKFAASDDPYPTIEKLVAQMMIRRDLAEKFVRLKILEYESHLQKAENEMLQDILHENLYKVVAKYGPAIEGMKEHVH